MTFSVYKIVKDNNRYSNLSVINICWQELEDKTWTCCQIHFVWQDYLKIRLITLIDHPKEQEAQNVKIKLVDSFSLLNGEIRFCLCPTSCRVKCLPLTQGLGRVLPRRTTGPLGADEKATTLKIVNRVRPILCFSHYYYLLLLWDNSESRIFHYSRLFSFFLFVVIQLLLFQFSGKKLFARYWYPKAEASIKGLVFICHGFAEHLGYYDEFAVFLANLNMVNVHILLSKKS